MLPHTETRPLQTLPVSVPRAHHVAAEDAGMVGPNAIIQTRRALGEALEAARIAQIFAAAGLARYLACDPDGMVQAQEAARLFRSLREVLSDAAADAILRDAGERTGDYIIAHRIPRLAQHVLRVLPGRVAGPVLLKAIAAHAWTFAGGATVGIETRKPLSITLAGNPLATPGCPWHLGVIETLFRTLISRHAHARHLTCCARGDKACRTEIDF